MPLRGLGRHLVVEMYECDGVLDGEEVMNYLEEAAKVSNAKVVKSFLHKFNPHGISAVVVIEESHLAVHTWPEYRFVALDVFTCGDETDPWRAYDYLRSKFKPKRVSVMEITRGILEESANI